MASPPKLPMPPGRRLRLDRRKALLDQAGLARLLGTTTEQVSLMEQNKQELSQAALAFIANPPNRVPVVATPKEEPSSSKPVSAPAEDAPSEVAPSGPAPPPPAPERSEGKDAAPRPLSLAPAKPRSDDIKQLEAALLTFFRGESFLVPKEMPDGTTQQVEATIPGLAQMIGMVDEFDGQIIQIYAPGMARAWAQLASENPMVHRWLNALTYGGAYRGVLAASLPAVMAIVMHHGVLGLGKPKEIVQEHAEPPAEYYGPG